MKKNESKSMGELIYGSHSILELLKAGRRRILSLYTTKPYPKIWATITQQLKYKVPINHVTRDVLTRMVGTTEHQSVVALATPFSFRKKFFTPSHHKFLVMLDGIQDPRNLGAILRSAYCTGVQGVILCKKNAAPLNAVALKSSAGLAEHLDIYEAASPVSAVQELNNAGYSIYLAALGGKNALDVSYTLPLCMVIGSEGTGITKSILSAGTQVMLPQRTADISYNASVAAGILLFTVSTRLNLV